MEQGLWILAAALGAALCLIAALLAKIWYLQKSAKEIETAFAERLTVDTNTLIGISSRDKAMRSLANAVNVQLRRLRAQRLRYQQGDAELKNAVTNISHDLRTPLTAICGYLDLLEAEQDPAAIRQYLPILRDRAALMAQLTEELFRYSVILANDGNAQPEPVDVNAVLEESAAAFYAALCRRGITPQIEMPAQRVIRTLDRSALARVFSNLLSNALKYSDGDLAVTLSETGEITFANTASALNGVDAGRLFDRFYTVESARHATGLGLAIARTLTQQMGGTLTARYEDHRLILCLQLPEAGG
ncbi:MAG: HAMP domain-containing histidine kinase [Subdoligranulum sp.]|nr:HAMP domain-containing histidine kinase [Subdoligranulum sp.]MBD5102452.1 HAMP domain-containing histidine kinase [Subdoligranulum sp.]